MNYDASNLSHTASMVCEGTECKGRGEGGVGGGGRGEGGEG
jgi:hypothetical protein